MVRDLHQIPPGATDDPPEPPRLRMLRRMVMLLTATMIAAILAIAGAVIYSITRSSAPSAPPPLTGEIEVPDGIEVLSVSRGEGRLYLLLRDREGLRHIEERDAEDRRLIGIYRLVPAD